jgi:hypothetical protein
VEWPTWPAAASADYCSNVYVSANFCVAHTVGLGVRACPRQWCAVDSVPSSGRVAPPTGIHRRSERPWANCSMRIDNSTTLRMHCTAEAYILRKTIFWCRRTHAYALRSHLDAGLHMIRRKQWMCGQSMNKTFETTAGDSHVNSIAGVPPYCSSQRSGLHTVCCNLWKPLALHNHVP